MKRFIMVDMEEFRIIRINNGTTGTIYELSFWIMFIAISTRVDYNNICKLYLFLNIP